MRFSGKGSAGVLQMVCLIVLVSEENKLSLLKVIVRAVKMFCQGQIRIQN